MIKVGFSRSESIIGKVIRWFTKSEVNHTFIVFTLGGYEWVLEASWFGVYIIPYERYVLHANVTHLFEIEDAKLNDMAMLRFIGAGYDYAGLVGMAWVMLGRALRKTWRNPWQSTKASFCSEMVASLLIEAKHPGAKELDPRATSPEDLLRILEKTNNP